MKIIYPGTFDPITNGHINLVERALSLFDGIILAVAVNSKKQTKFSIDERVLLAKSALKKYGPKVQVCQFSGLLIDFAKKEGVKAILRGLRAVSDFEYEFQLAAMNKRLQPNIETLFIAPAEQYAYLSSSLVREISELGGDVSQFVPKEVNSALYRIKAINP
ncbi:MAG: pantetheine-phosphate adenylyltransferase [Gammaproteobacteria bacterium]